MSLTHPYLLGKKKAKSDSRNLQLRTIFKGKAKVPAEFSLGIKYPGIRPHMFGNDKVGDCVIAEQAHHTLYFELIEQKRVLLIRDSDVLTEYYRQTGGQDTGLYLLDSLNENRKHGLVVSSESVQTETYKIEAFAQINPKDRTEVRRVISSNIGAKIGLNLPLSAQKEFATGKPWSATNGPPGSWGGHCVMLVGYDAKYVTCFTWGQTHRMTWTFFNRYCDEAYAVFDAVDKFKKVIDAPQVHSFLASLSPDEPLPVV